MKIKELHIFGFKSFPNKTTIKFSKGITAILGPNGCGKTNILDALRWALGEQSFNVLRCTKNEELIFAGTKDNPPLNFCEVRLILENDGEWPELGSEIEIRRRYYRSGESEYYLNRQICRLKDIEDIFLKTGLAVYTILDLPQIRRIAHGEVKELFEEVANLRAFRENKKEIERKLQLAELDLQRLDDIIKERRRIVSTLRRQAKKLEEYYQLKKEEKSLKIKLVVKRIGDLVKNEKELLATLDELQRNLAAEQKALTKEQGELKEIKERISTERELKNRWHNEYVQLEDKLKINEEKRNSLLEKEFFLTKEKEKKEKELQTLSTALHQLEERFVFKKAKLTEVKNELSKVEGQYHQTQKEIKNCEGEIAQLEKLISEMWSELRVRFDSSLKRDKELSRIGAEIEQVKNLITELQKEEALIKNEIAALAKKKKEKEDWQKRLKDKLRSKEEELVKSLKEVLKDNLLGPVKSLLTAEEGKEKILEKLLLSYLNFYVIKNLDINLGELKILPEGFLFDPKSLKVEDKDSKPEAVPLKDFVSIEDGCPSFISKKIEKCYLVDDFQKAKELVVNHPNCSFITKDGILVDGEGVIDLKKGSLILEKLEETVNISSSEIEIEQLKNEISKKRAELAHLKSLLNTQKENLTNLQIDQEKKMSEKVLIEKEAASLRSQLTEEENRLLSLRNKLHNESEQAKQYLNKVLILKEAYSRLDIEIELLDKEISKDKEEKENLLKFIIDYEQQIEKIREASFCLKEEVSKLEKELKAKEDILPDKLINELIQREEELEKSINARREKIESYQEQINDERVKIATLNKEIELVKNSAAKEFGIDDLTSCKIEDAEEKGDTTLDYEERMKEISEILAQLGHVNPLAKDDYEREKEELLNLLQQRKDIIHSINNLKKSLAQLENNARQLFFLTFNKVREEFKKTFISLFIEGEADITLTSPETPFDSEIIITAKPKGKNPKRLEHLSDGEKALLAVALLFAFYRVRQTSFCFLDEVDAPLDDINIGRFVKYLKELSLNTQIIVITHNRFTLESADVLLGVTTSEPGVSSVFTIKAKEDLEI